jgi:hypothetical protein
VRWAMSTSAANDANATPPTRSGTMRRRLARLALAVGAVGGCATLGGLGDSLGTRVVGSGTTVVLSWEAEHPLSRQLASDRRIRLRADYAVDGKPVSEEIAAASGEADRRATLTLPTSLKGIPDGEVCLYFQPSAGVRSLPIRAASASPGDTAGFRYPSWEAWVRDNTRRQRAQRELSVLERQHQEAREQAENARRTLGNKGLEKPADCLTRAGVPPLERPFDVVAAERHDAVARKVCVGRARRIEEALGKDVVALVTRHTAGAYPPALRASQAREFTRDWKEWLPVVLARGYRPELGVGDDGLGIVPTLIPLFRTWGRGEALSDTQMTALAVGVLDAYHGCVEDGRKQLATKLEAWERTLRDKPQRDRLYREYLVQQCQREWATYEGLRRHASEIQEQCDRHRAAIAQLGSTPNAAVADRPQTLNFQPCAHR